MKNVSKLFLGWMYLAATASYADDAAFKIDGKVVNVKDLYKEDQSAFFKIEQDKYDLIEQLAKQKYLDFYFEREAKKKGASIEAIRNEYIEKNSKISNKELTETLEKFKEHPQLKKLTKKEQEDQIRQYLTERQKRELFDGIIAAGIQKKELQIMYEKPKEPVFNVKVESKDFVRYGASPDDIQPKGCSDKCAITVVEYSEFECPFCSRVMPSVKRLLTEYQGKVRWVVRDFPLSFHDRARPAAIAAHCAGDQKKFWNMYTTLFENQRSLGDNDLESYAKKIPGLDFKKWKDCVAKPKDVEKAIDANFESGSKLGVSGTPAFFVNGRRLSGALPYEDFKKVFEEELASVTPAKK